MFFLQETIYRIHGCPFTIAHLSDLHDKPFGPVAASLRRRRPDVICVTGDFVNAKRRPEKDVAANAANILPFFAMCTDTAPTFVSLGNHEWMLTGEDFALLRSTGALILDNRFVEYKNAAIGGLSSALFTRYQREILARGLQEQYPYPYAAGITARDAPDLEWLEDYVNFPGFKLLLCHHPEYYERYLRAVDLSLVLSGHAHGGQFRLFGRGLYAPGQGLLPRYTEGVHFRRLAVSRGLSNTQLVPRLFNPPEIVYLLPGD